MSSADFLVEILTEELPPKALSKLSTNFLNEVTARLKKSQVTFGNAQSFATPRRLALLIKNLSDTQPDNLVERKGPAYAAAFDQQGNPTRACEGFAMSCGVTVDQLSHTETAQGKWVSYSQKISGKKIHEIIPSIVEDALRALPIPKKMRWGNNSFEFVRPVHSVIMLYGKDIIPATIFGIVSDRTTFGHRFHSPELITIEHAEDYEKNLETAFVIADFAKRKSSIESQVSALVTNMFGDKATAVMPAELVDEVCGLVEWPIALAGKFAHKFLDVPAEALISAMQSHQRYFSVVDGDNKLMQYFITLSNIASTQPELVIAGNERVLHARLSDAAFFYTQDKKQSLDDRFEQLKKIVYHAKLGTVFDKTARVVKLSAFIAEKMQLNNLSDVKRAALLSKTDLTTALVGEFPELQGVAGYYYATAAHESAMVAHALKEYYYPRFAGDILPTENVSVALALADRLDTLIGVFGINQQPTGDKDPFALRRAAVGVLRIIIEKQLQLDLVELLAAAYQVYATPLANKSAVTEVATFIQERLKPWYQEQNIAGDVFAAVSALNLTNLFDFHLRINAVNNFKNLAEAESLSAANKRVSNILDKNNAELVSLNIDATLFESAEEKDLAEKLQQQIAIIQPLQAAHNYTDMLNSLATLRQPIDAFFEKVMVMTEDKPRRANRLSLLNQLRESFMQVADIALLTLQK